MLGLIFIYFIGKYFYDLANQFEKKKWLFVILGIASYYVGSFFGGIIFGFIASITAPEFFKNTTKLGLQLVVLPIALLICWGYYQFLKKRWSSKPNKSRIDILDS